MRLLGFLRVIPLWRVAQWVSRAPSHHTLPAFLNLTGSIVHIKIYSLFDVLIEIWSVGGTHRYPNFVGTQYPAVPTSKNFLVVLTYPLYSRVSTFCYSAYFPTVLMFLFIYRTISDLNSHQKSCWIAHAGTFYCVAILSKKK